MFSLHAKIRKKPKQVMNELIFCSITVFNIDNNMKSLLSNISVY